MEKIEVNYCGTATETSERELGGKRLKEGRSQHVSRYLIRSQTTPDNNGSLSFFLLSCRESGIGPRVHTVALTRTKNVIMRTFRVLIIE